MHSVKLRAGAGGDLDLNTGSILGPMLVCEEYGTSGIYGRHRETLLGVLKCSPEPDQAHLCSDSPVLLPVRRCSSLRVLLCCQCMGVQSVRHLSKGRG